MTSSPELMPYGRRITALAQQHPEQLAITVLSESGERSDTTWAELERLSLAATRALMDVGVKTTSRVVIGLSRELTHAVWSLATWRLGACVVPLNPRLPEAERRRLVELAKPNAVIGGDAWSNSPRYLKPDCYEGFDPVDPRQLEDAIPQPGKALASGGSTGSPKLIVDQHPWAFVPGRPASQTPNGIGPCQRQLVTGPLYHNSPFANCYGGLFQDHYLVMMERFDARRAIQLTGEYKINYMALVPAQLKRMLEPAREHPENLASIQAILHTGAVCPAWLKRAWIDLVGGECIHEMFGSTEGMGTTSIRGDEWLAHPGSVGKPWMSSIKILGPLLEELPPNEIGEIFGRPADGVRRFAYVGHERARVASDGYMSVGDLGWLDPDGYLYVADRRQDVIISGGINIYPAEVEAALLAHPAVEDVVIVGRDDEDWGKRVHAIVQMSAEREVLISELKDFCRDRLEPEKVPKSFEIRSSIPRDEAGKVRRSAL